MLRFLAYIFLFFILFRIVGYVLRLFIGGGRTRNQQSTSSSSDPIDINNPKSKKKSNGYKGGEYVDYEEIE